MTPLEYGIFLFVDGVIVGFALRPLMDRWMRRRIQPTTIVLEIDSHRVAEGMVSVVKQDQSRNFGGVVSTR